MTWRRNGITLAHALRRAADQFVKEGRSNADSVLIVFTNGNQIASEIELSQVGAMLRKQGITVRVITTDGSTKNVLRPLVPKDFDVVVVNLTDPVSNVVITTITNGLLADVCAATYCQHGADCIRQFDGTAKCVCRQSCSENYLPLCGSNGKTYINECTMKRESCLWKLEISLKHSGVCVPSIGTNLVIALDGSQNVKPEDFDKMKNSIKNMLKIMIVSQQDSRVGVVEYSDRVDVAFHLNKYISKKDVVAALNNIQPSIGNGQNLNEVLRIVAEMFTVKNGARPGQPKVFILFTSGKSTGTEPLQQFVKQLKSLGVTIFVIGTSYDVDRDELSSIAPGNKDDVFVTDDCNDLSPLISKIALRISNHVITVQPSMDVVFALGASSPIGSSVLNLQKDIVESIMNLVSLINVRYGMLEYGKSARVVLDLGGNRIQVQGALQGISWKSDATGLDEVLRKASEMFQQNSTRGSHKRLILFVTTQSTSLAQNIQKGVDSLTKAGIDIIVVSIGNNVKISELETITKRDKILFVDPRDSAKTISPGITEHVIQDPCNNIECSFYATCALTSSNIAMCQCNLSLSNSFSKFSHKLCGSDGKVYGSKEEMNYESCRKQEKIDIQEYEKCEQSLYNYPLDLAFAIDGSDSMTSTDFNYVRAFIKSTVDRFPISEDDVRVALLEYSDNIDMKFGFLTHTNKPGLLRAIDGVMFSRGSGVLTDHVLAEANQLFSPITGSRSRVPKVLVVITDDSSTGGRPLSVVASPLLEAGVKVYVVGIGPRVIPADWTDVVQNENGVVVVNTSDHINIVKDNIERNIRGYAESKIFQRNEVIFVFGTSGNSQVFERSRQVIKELINQESLPSLSYGVVVYGQKALSVIDLNFNWKKSKITDFISKMDEPRPGIKFKLGIQKALEMFIEQGNPNAHRLIVLFTHSPTDATSAELHAIKMNF
ncbi:collagen alpha-3(VI) chain-like [Xenia sp. Carnegie-2017]|uniref:collagen alpha-3(VI) chain-like n=1 Tax=Xenia sp. Carnegie-2017 TaxID=2897299 RepID=UPI001F046980|nr:collagen alpha-3(VI) chain-like [Xenia sp. Carnegie-2017]